MLKDLFLFFVSNYLTGCKNDSDMISSKKKNIIIKNHNLKIFLKTNNKKKKYAAIYFSSSNCPSCKKINKKLIERVKNAEKKYSIGFYVCIYCNSFQEREGYLKKFSNFIPIEKDIRSQFKEELDIETIPTVSLINLNNYSIVSKNILPEILKNRLEKILI